MAQPDWAPQRQKGESEASYKKRYYTAQRQDAEKRGRGGSDTAQAEVRKIYGKLGRKAPQDASGGGTDRVDRAALGLVGMIGGGRAKAGVDLAEGAAKGIGSALARRGVSAAAKTATRDAGSALAKRGTGQLAKKGESIVAKAAPRTKPRVSAKVERPALGSSKSSALAQRTSPIAKRAPTKAPARAAATVQAAPLTNSKKKASKKK